MLSVTLSKDWGPHKAGETIEVDNERAAKLLADGWARSYGGKVEARPGGVAVKMAPKDDDAA